MADMKRSKQGTQLESVEKHITNTFKLTSIEAEQVVIALQRVLKAKPARA